MTANKPKKDHPWRKDAPKWVRNVQFMRLSFPPVRDEMHHDMLVALEKRMQAIVDELGISSEISCNGFYRADSDWDNIGDPDACWNSPDRGSNADGIDNSP
jgi:hypothetical protein